VFEAARPRAGVHGVFEDSLPDDWGRGLLIRRYGLPRAEQSPPHLLARLGRHGLGALAYAAGDAPPAAEPPAAADTVALIEAAARYDQDPASIGDDDLAAQFRAASSPGGARPKLIMDDGGTSCIAKLGSSRDRVDSATSTIT
jgi:serine/threonine-protein kinase HipA